MSKVTHIVFTINAAKGYDYDESTGNQTPNWAVCDEATDAVRAMEKLHSVRDYPIVEFHIESTFDDGTRVRVPVFGGVTETLVNGLWVPEAIHAHV